MDLGRRLMLTTTVVKRENVVAVIKQAAIGRKFGVPEPVTNSNHHPIMSTPTPKKLKQISTKPSQRKAEVVVSEKHRELVATFAAANGLMKRGTTHLEQLPLTAFPFRFAGEMYRRAVELAIPFNKLVMAIARDEEWLRETLKPLVEYDAEFTGRLFSIYERFGTSAKARQNIRLGIFRSDYMWDKDGDNSGGKNRLLQVELNTISAGLGGVAPQVARLHRYLARGPMHEVYASLGLVDPEKIPLNSSLEEMGKAMARAHEMYVKQQQQQGGGERKREYGVVFVIEPHEWNVVDHFKIEQRFGEACLDLDTPPARIFRLTLPEIHRRARVEEGTHRLLLRLADDGDEDVRGHDDDRCISGEETCIEVSLCYFRSGYAPPSSKDEAENEAWWKGREMIESSLSVKCPDVAVHLIGSKKVQQRLVEPGELERFVSDENEVKALRACFARQYSLSLPVSSSSSSSCSAVKARMEAIKEPGRWVLKPSREGGGNNLYGEDVARALQDKSPAELSSYVLMERIFPVVQRDTVFLRESSGRGKSQPQRGESYATCELGIFSVVLWEEEEAVRVNRVAGYLLRTKVASANEGGVSHGEGAIDSLYLV